MDTAVEENKCEGELKDHQSKPLLLPFKVVEVKRGGLNMNGVVATERIPACTF